MHAAVIAALTGPNAVEVREVAEPALNDHQVLVDVEYAGVGFPDVLHTRGEYQLRPELALRPGMGSLRHSAGRWTRFPDRRSRRRAVNSRRLG